MPGVFLAATLGLHAQNTTAPFDLNGPRIDMRVTRGGKTLPIAEVPNLQPGDKVWVHPELPSSQSAHYLLVVAFLRGATNPPPENWFLKEETWQKKLASEGIHFTVPPDAQQTLLFLAPETGGDYQDAAQCGARTPRLVCAGFAGPEPGQPGPLAGADLSEQRAGHSGDESGIA